MRPTSCIARAGMIASLDPSKVVANSVSLMLNLYESVVTILTREPSKEIKIPVNTGRVSSLEYERETFSTVSTSASPFILKASASSNFGSRGKSSAAYARMRYSFSPAESRTTPSELSCTRVRSSLGIERTTSLKMRAGMTTFPVSSTFAGDEVWIDSSISVAESHTTPSPASNKIPVRSGMVERADTPRETNASFLPKDSVLQIALIVFLLPSLIIGSLVGIEEERSILYANCAPEPRKPHSICFYPAFHSGHIVHSGHIGGELGRDELLPSKNRFIYVE